MSRPVNNRPDHATSLFFCFDFCRPADGMSRIQKKEEIRQDRENKCPVGVKVRIDIGAHKSLISGGLQTSTQPASLQIFSSPAPGRTMEARLAHCLPSTANLRLFVDSPHAGSCLMRARLCASHFRRGPRIWATGALPREPPSRSLKFQGAGTTGTAGGPGISRRPGATPSWAWAVASTS